MTTRRQFLLSTALLASAYAWLDPARAAAQGVSNLIELTGEVQVNGRRLTPDGVIQTGDRVQTGPGSSCGFTVGRDAFLLRPNTDLTLTRGSSLFIIEGARLLTGAMASVFGRSERPRSVISRTVTAGIRGTGFYVETRPDSTYFCTCFGNITLTSAAGDSELIGSTRHVARRISVSPVAGKTIEVAALENHEDEELDRLALLVGQRTPWSRR